MTISSKSDNDNWFQAEMTRDATQQQRRMPRGNANWELRFYSASSTAGSISSSVSSSASSVTSGAASTGAVSSASGAAT